ATTKATSMALVVTAATGRVRSTRADRPTRATLTTSTSVLGTTCVGTTSAASMGDPFAQL
ncbi:MAG: hypothetical protein J5808_06055, partial [Paludibacteraceae bacterium]|nr:hypothetical protein [Paludibacteraceae bacterium]